MLLRERTIGLGYQSHPVHHSLSFDWKSELDQYMEDRDVKHLDNVYWDMIMLDNHELYGYTLRYMYINIDKYEIHKNDQIFELYELLYMTGMNRYYEVLFPERYNKVKDNKKIDFKRYNLATDDENWMKNGIDRFIDYIRKNQDKFDEYTFYRIAFDKVYTYTQYAEKDIHKYTLFMAKNPDITRTYEACIKSLVKLKKYDQVDKEWYWLKYYSLSWKYHYYLYQKMLTYHRKHTMDGILQTFVHAVMCREKECLMTNRISQGTILNLDEVHQKKVVQLWLGVYDKALDLKLFPDGVNTIMINLLDQQLKKFTTLDDYDFIENIKIPLYQIHKKIGTYKTNKFHDSKRIVESEINPVHYLKNIYTARGFLSNESMEEKEGIIQRIFGKKSPDANKSNDQFVEMVSASGKIIRLERINSKESINQIIKRDQGNYPFFHYLVFNNFISDDDIKAIEEDIKQKELEQEISLTYRLVYPDEAGKYKCRGTYNGILT